MIHKAPESVELLSAQVLAQLAIGILLTDREGRILWANERQRYISGAEAEVLVGNSIFDQTSFEQLGLCRVLRQVLNQREPHYHFITHQGNFCRAEILPLQSDGKFSGTAILFYDREGEGHTDAKVVGVAAASDDGGSKKEEYLEFELAEQRALLFLLTHALNTLPHPVCVIDASSQILYTNTAFQSCFAANGRALGASLMDYLPAGECEGVERSLAECFRTGSARGILQKSGATSELLLSKLDERTGITAAAMVVLSGSGVNGQVQSDTFADKFDSLCNFTGRLVHDLRNPLTALICQLDFLRNEDLYEKGGVHKFQKGIDLIQQQVQGIDAVLEQVEPFGNGGMDEFGEAQLADVLVNARVVAELQRPHNNVHIEAELADDLPPMICEPIRLQKALVELMLNALEAAGDKGHVSLSCRYDAADDRYEIRISDDGPGISAEIKGRMFDPFFTTKKKPGSGLGLTIAYANIARQGGRIQMETAEPRGTEVVIQLPREPIRPPGKKTATRDIK